MVRSTPAEADCAGVLLIEFPRGVGISCANPRHCGAHFSGCLTSLYRLIRKLGSEYFTNVTI